MTSPPLRFRDFELDPAQFELRRAGHRVRLERKPLELLILLVEKRGTLVSREEIIQRVWGDDVYFDAERGINNAIRKIRAALHDESSQPYFVETVVGKGYRFIALVKGATPAPSPTIAPAVANTNEPPRLSWFSRAGHLRRVLAATGLVLTILAIVLALPFGHVRQRLFASNSTRRIQSLAVLPLANLSGDPTQEYFAEGMTEAVIGRLSMIRGLRVISRTSVMRFKDTRMSAPEIAKVLNVDAIVEGSVIRDGGRVRVHAQLIRAATDDHFWSETYDRELRDALELESDVAQAIAKRVEVTVTGQERTRLVAARQISPEVYESYLKGRFGSNNNRAEVEQNISYFEDAIGKDPKFAPVYVGLASAYNNLASVFVGGPPKELRPKLIDAARKALELDPELAEAHVILATALQKQWQWDQAEAEYRKALEISPNNASAHEGLATWLLCQGRIEEALAWSRRARELDPLGDSGITIAWIQFHARRYDESIREFHSFLAAHPDSGMALWLSGFALVGKGQYEEAISVFEKTASMTNRNPGSIELLATAHGYAGHRAEALRLIDELKRRRKTGYVPAGVFINPYFGLRDYDQAFAGFEMAYQEKSGIMQFLKVHPFFDPVRGDPRFTDLLHRVGLDQSR